MTAKGYKPKRSALEKREAAKELNRTALYSLPDSPYKALMLECCALFDAYESTPKQMSRVGLKAPAPKARIPKPRKKAA